jgi:GntR family transcriptional regulator, rspAB operon transcriptional repressor
MSKKTEVYSALQQKIITAEYRAGQQLYEKELMQEYDIGRTPLREIFQEFQRKGLIEIIPKLGTRVFSMDIQELSEAVQIRRELEGLAAELSARRIHPEQIKKLRQLLDSAAAISDNSEEALKKLSNIDFEFHQIIYEACGNKQLKEIIEGFVNKMIMYWFQVGFSAVDFQSQFEELEELYEALKEKKPKKAREVMNRHIEHFIQLVKDNFFELS